MKKKAALWYLRRGFPVYPIKPNDRTPLVEWKTYQVHMPTEDQVSQWWDRWPDANVAMATGKLSNTTVIDTDTPEAIERIQSYLPDHLVLPIVETPRGGLHFYFSFTAGLRNWVGVFPGVDIRTQGGQIVLPPSIRGEKKYRWLDGLAVHQVERPMMPEALRQAIIHAKKKSEPVYREKTTDPGRYGAAALAQELAAVAMAGKGFRNSTLNSAAYSLAQLVAGGELDAAQVETALTAAAVSIGLSAAEAQATIRSGMTSGQQAPRKRNENRNPHNAAASRKKYAKVRIIRPA